MSRNEERKTTAKGFIVRLNTETMQTDVYPFTEQVKYTRTVDRAAAFVVEKLGLGDDAMVKVTELVQDEYERRVYDASSVFYTAMHHNRAYAVNEDGSDDSHAADVADCKRIVVDVYEYSMACMLQTFGGDYRAVKVSADYVTECRSGLGQIQNYLKDVLEATRTGNIRLYNTDGTVTYLIPGELAYDRIAAWDTESRYRSSHKMACYLTAEELALIPFTVYGRGEYEDDDK